MTSSRLFDSKAEKSDAKRLAKTLLDRRKIINAVTHEIIAKLNHRIRHTSPVADDYKELRESRVQIEAQLQVINDKKDDGYIASIIGGIIINENCISNNMAKINETKDDTEIGEREKKINAAGRMIAQLNRESKSDFEDMIEGNEQSYNAITLTAQRVGILVTESNDSKLHVIDIQLDATAGVISGDHKQTSPKYG